MEEKIPLYFQKREDLFEYTTKLINDFRKGGKITESLARTFDNLCLVSESLIKGLDNKIIETKDENSFCYGMFLLLANYILMMIDNFNKNIEALGPQQKAKVLALEKWLRK